MRGPEEATKFLDEKISETEQEFERLRQRLAEVEADIQALRKARALLAGEDARAREDGRPREDARPREEARLREDARPRESARQRESVRPAQGEVRATRGVPPTAADAGGQTPGPIKTLIIDILREAGRPLQVNELVDRLREKGKEADHAAVTDAIAGYVKAGKLWRTAPNTYGLPKGLSL